MKTNILAAIFLILLIISGTAFMTARAAENNGSNEDRRTLTVNGEYKMSVDPDKFTAVVVIETEAPTAEESQSQNAIIAAKVEKAVSSDHKLKTVTYNIQPIYE